MNPLIETYLSCVRKVKIIHTLPGRLRVNIYGVKQFPDFAKQYAPILQKKVTRLPGVSQASLCMVTGNLLIVYDPSKTTEAELMIWLNTAWEKLSELLKWVGDNNIQDEPSIASALERTLSKL
mgnify:CR=1 FL=1